MAENADRRSFKIGEVCRMADVQPYVLRYWETEFPPLSPNKSGGGQRLYSQHEIDIILRIKQLLYSEGFTIAGAKKRLEAELVQGLDLGAPVPADAIPAKSAAIPSNGVVKDIRNDLEKILRMLGK